VLEFAPMNDNLPVPVPVRAAGADAVALASRPVEMAAFALLVRVVLQRFAAKCLDAKIPADVRFAASLDEAAREGAALLDRVAAGEPGAMQLLQRSLARFAAARSDIDSWFARTGTLPWTWEEAAEAADVQFPRVAASADSGRSRIRSVVEALSSYSEWFDGPDSAVGTANVATILLERLQGAVMVRLFSLDGVAPRRVARPGAGQASVSSAAGARAKDSAPADPAEPPRCPKCGAPMRKRVKRDTGEEFWGCSAYASGCRGTRSIS